MLRNRGDDSNIHESFSDMALLMLATFVFILACILITARMQEEGRGTGALGTHKDAQQMSATIAQLEQERDELKEQLESQTNFDADAQVEQVLEMVGLNSAKGRKDFDLFVDGLKHIPGKDIHLVIDATGSMHGATTFLVPLLRVIMYRSGKELAGLTWFSDRKKETYHGNMGAVFDSLMTGAPFSGSDETIGDAFAYLAETQPVPGAYILPGDEPSDDPIAYGAIPSPVFPIALGKADINTGWAYETIATKTRGKMLSLRFE